MKQTLILFMQDEPGVLNRISSLVRRRNFNIDSIVAGRTEINGITRMTLVVNEPNEAKRVNIYNNLKRLVDVYDVVDATKENCHVREHALVKIALKPDEINEIDKLVLEAVLRYKHETPKIRAMFEIFEPIAVPKAMSSFPLITADIATNISGAEVPAAIRVNPTTRSLIPKYFAITEE